MLLLMLCSSVKQLMYDYVVHGAMKLRREKFGAFSQKLKDLF